MKKVLKLFFQTWSDSFSDTHLARFQERAQIMAQKMAHMQSHPLIEKCLRGEPILSSRSKIQWGRKLGHMFCGLFFLFLFGYSGLPKWIIWTLFSGFMIWGFTLEIVRHLNPKINDWVCNAFRPVMREREKDKINSGIFYMLSMSLVFFVFPFEVASLTMLFIAVGDPVAGIVGVYYGKHKLSEHSSLEGVLACFATCAFFSFVSAVFIFEHYQLSGMNLMIFTLLGGIVGALAESSFKKLDDNLVMPLVSAPCLWILLQILHN